MGDAREGARDIRVTCTASRVSPTVGPFFSHDPLRYH